MQDVIHQDFALDQFVFFFDEAILVADEKAHQALYCMGGDQFCGECDGDRKTWALDPYSGKVLTLEEVCFPLLFLAFFFLT